MNLGGLGARFLALSPAPLPMVTNIETDVTGNYIYVTFNKIMFSGTPNVNELNFVVDGSATGGVPNTDNNVSWVDDYTMVIEVIGILLSTDVLTLSYTPGLPGLDQLRDPIGNLVPAFTDEPITNLVAGGPAVAPVLQSAEAVDFGTILRLIYDIPLDETSVPDPSDYPLANTVATIDSIVVDGVNVDLILDVPIAEDETSAEVSYVPGTNPVREITGAEDAAAFADELITHTEPAVLTLMVSRTTSSDTWTPTRTGTSRHECVGGGCGGTTNTSGGGGGAAAVLLAFSHTGGVGYARVAGAGSTAGASPSAGSDSTFNTTSCVAKGGGEQGSSDRDKGGRASQCTGDLTYDGGNAAVGTGAQAGGASAGTSGSATNTTPGIHDGARSYSTNGLPHSPGGGGRSGMSAGQNGANGRVRSFWKEVSDNSLPEMRGTQLGVYRSTADNTNHSIVLPPGAEVGDTVRAFIGWDDNATVSSFTGWTLMDSSIQTTLSGAVYERVLAGSDPVEIILSGAQQLSCLAVAEKNLGSSSITTATDATGNANPPNITFTSGTYRIYACALLDGAADLSMITAVPSGYDGYGTLSASAINSPHIALVWKTVTSVTSEDPGAFTNSSVRWIAFTVAAARV